MEGRYSARGSREREITKKLQEAKNAGEKNFVVCGNWFRVCDFQESERGIWKYRQKVLVPLENVSSCYLGCTRKAWCMGIKEVKDFMWRRGKITCDRV